MSTIIEQPEYGVRPAGYRLPVESHVGRVRLQVSDLERSVGYYGGVLGLKLIRRGEGKADFGAYGSEMTLIELVERKGANPVPRRGRLGLYHFAILLPDRVSLGALVGHFAEARVPLGASDHLVSEALYLQDPDGLGIEIYADRPRASWAHQDRQLVMATEPLDLAALARDAGGKRWEGMPAGTVIGHVHLHVGDLPQAELFYHQGLGLDKIVWSYPGALFMSAGGYHHHLGVNSWAAGAPAATEEDARLLEWVLGVPTTADADAAATNLQASGFSTSPEGGGWVAADPWGTKLRIATFSSQVSRFEPPGSM